ncbi:hypothetical protein RchiOBHm_Chr6g0253301 [Rosa chinensis]|uniref:Uncharacterized protein n=1 Tax=Rosa chinensis TaxID=74649 RepID=A0A2P6PLA7_ROSCH|nr:hypothetical protein RchiOBHm_Chr6g0253301 [Rosa chinensis]
MLAQERFSKIWLQLASTRKQIIMNSETPEAQALEKLEKRVNEVEQYYLRKGSLQPTTSKEKDGDKHFNTIKKQQQDASCRDAAAAKRMRDLLNDSDIFAPTFSLAFT